MNKEITIFKNIYNKENEPHYISVDIALKRIKEGNSKELINKIISSESKEERDNLKKELPIVYFSGILKQEKSKESFVSHSGYICVEWDNVKNVEKKKSDIIKNRYVYAAWKSPSFTGLRALIKLENGSSHKDAFESLRKDFIDIDKSCGDITRGYFESYDPDIYINKNADIYKVKSTNNEKINKFIPAIFKWLEEKDSSFSTGERNNYIYLLAGALCRFGITKEEAIEFCLEEFYNSKKYSIDGFSKLECKRTISSAYRANDSEFGKAIEDDGQLKNKKTLKEVFIELTDDYTTDIFYGKEMLDDALNLFENGYPSLSGIGVTQIDELFKMRRGELTILTGYGNAGKTQFLNWMLVIRALLYDEKFCMFSPEAYPAYNFYNKLIEILLGGICVGNKSGRITKDNYIKAFNFISEHFFYVYPQKTSPSPEYIFERAGKLLIKEQIDGIIIDPFNQMDNDLKTSMGMRDKYLEKFLSDAKRKALVNNIYTIIVAHPKNPSKDKEGKHAKPTGYDISDGAMWMNKADNILIYHRPKYHEDKKSPESEISTYKIKEQPTVGTIGEVTMIYDLFSRRYIINGHDPIFEILKNNKSKFKL